jgi:hypothetical protein
MRMPNGRDEFVFVPQVGFRLAHGGLQSENVVVEHGGETLTARLTSDRDGTDLRITIGGVDVELDFRQSRPAVAVLRLTDDRGQVVEERISRFLMQSTYYRLMEGPTQFQRYATFDRLAPDVRSVELEMTGDAGEWHLTIPVEPVTREGPRGNPAEATAVVDDIEVGVTLAARTETLTAIELYAFDHRRPETMPIDRAPRWIEGVSTFEHMRGLGQDLLMLRDNTGAHHLERPRPVQDQARRGRRREVALFEGLPAAATSASFEVPYIAIRERSDELKVPVPGETEIAMSGCRARVTTSRVTRSSDSTVASPSPIEGLNGPCTRVVIVPLDGETERQLVTAGIMESNDRGMTVSRSRAEAPVIEVPDPSGDSAFITLKAPLIRVPGPWRLEFQLPEPG